MNLFSKLFFAVQIFFNSKIYEIICQGICNKKSYKNVIYFLQDEKIKGDECMIYMLLDDFLKCNKNITKKRILIYIIIT